MKIIFWVGDLGMVGGIGIFVVDFYFKSVIRIDGRFGLLVNVIFLDDEKDFDWAAFGGGLCEFGLG